MQESRVCWLQKKADESGKITIGCGLCNRYGMIKNTNGQVKKWAISDYHVLALNQIEEHATQNEKHIEGG